MSRIKGHFAGSYDDFIKRESLLPDGLLQLVESFRPADILEFGCGTGTVAVGLSLKGYKVTGVDISPDMLKQARKKGDIFKVKTDFKNGDIVNIDLKRKFDLLLCLGNTVPLIHRLPDARRLFRNFARHLKPEGVLIIQQLNYDKILRDKPRTFAVDHSENQIRIKQYTYGKGLIDFIITLVDYSGVPPRMNISRPKIRPWKKRKLLSQLHAAGFYKLSAGSNYAMNRFDLKSKDLIVVGKLKPF